VNDRDAIALQLTHRFASEVNRALADSRMTIDQLAVKIGVSSAFIRRLLQGEDHLDMRLTLRLFADIIWATGQWMTIAGSPVPPVKKRKTVKPDGVRE
jgi:plasmid maintenance system antidote protein VapI